METNTVMVSRQELDSLRSEVSRLRGENAELEKRAGLYPITVTFAEHGLSVRVKNYDDMYRVEEALDLLAKHQKEQANV